jgi:hypothetical protein
MDDDCDLRSAVPRMADPPVGETRVKFMTSTPLKSQTELAPAITRPLCALRQRIRQYIWAEGIASMLAWLGAAFWMSLGLDWFFEPPVYVRIVVLTAVSGVLAAVVIQRIVRRLFVRVTESNLATLLERRFPHLNDSLLTAVGLLPCGGNDDIECNPQMLAATRREAALRMQTVSVGAVFNIRPLRQVLLAALLLAVSVTAFVVIDQASVGVWARRMLAFSQELWPRRVELKIDGFDERGVKKVARGSDVEITVRAEARLHQIPSSVKIRYRDEGGSRGTAMMDRIGQVDPRKEAYQPFAYTRRNVLAPIHFDVLGGDAVLRDLKLEVAENPTVSDWSLRCEYPAYLKRPPRTLPVTGVTPLPRGTRATVLAAANKELVRVAVAVATEPEAAKKRVATEKISNIALGPNRRSFTYVLSLLDTDITLLFTLSDTDGITSREPIRLGLAAVPDQPPQVAAQLDGVGTAITPNASVTVTGRVTDDYGLDQLGFEYQIDQNNLKTAAARRLDGRPTEYPLEGLALDVSPLQLRPGQKIAISLKAVDGCDLGDSPNEGAGERWLLDVVTPEQLRAMLEARELVLRQRFESVIQETTETRDLLTRWETDATRKPDRAPGSEPGDKPSPKADDSPEQQLAQQLLRVSRAVTNCRKNTHETLGLVDSFEDIRKQLINNRLDTVDLRERLGQGIADPLRKIAQDLFPELDRLLEKLQTSLEQKSPQAAQHREQAGRQADALLLAMHKVLDRMLEMESYNEAIELLREIIKDQEQLHRQTEERQKQKLKELLND